MNEEFDVKKDILMVTQFTNLSGETGNSRFIDIISQIDKNKYDVELITSSFYHIKKQQRNMNIYENEPMDFRLKMIHEPGYKKNVSIKRFYSHYVMARNLKKYLRKRVKPDVIYCSLPSLSVGKVIAKYAKMNNIKFIIDIQDLWPEAFMMVLNLPIISNIIFHPFKISADFIYSCADEIIAVSETYSNRALKINKKVNEALSIYLGTDLTKFDRAAKTKTVKTKENNELWIAYIGTLGNSYDLITVIDALKKVQDLGYANLKLIIMGDGPLKSKFYEYSKRLNINSEFMGLLPYDEMVKILVNCDIAVNPIVKGAAQSIINKVADYAAAGLPVLNTQENLEYRNLIENYEIGFNCINQDSDDLAKKIVNLIINPVMMKKFGENNRKLAEEKFDRSVTYKLIADIICK